MKIQGFEGIVGSLVEALDSSYFLHGPQRLTHGMFTVGRCDVLVAGSTAVVSHIGNVGTNVSIGRRIGQTGIRIILGFDPPFPDQEAGGSKENDNEDARRFSFPSRHVCPRLVQSPPGEDDTSSTRILMEYNNSVSQFKRCEIGSAKVYLCL